MDRQQVIQLFEKYVAGNCTEEEKRLVEISFSQYLQESDELPSPEEVIRATDEMHAVLLQHLRAKDRSRRILTLWAPIAAAIILLITVGIFLYPKFSTQTTALSVDAAQIGPGTDKAILTLADGRKIDLDKAEEGQLIDEEGIKINKKENGLLTYEIEDKGENAPIAYHTISTPNGGQYKVVLPDGSCVWLNASSSLKYPTRFLSQRRVELNGEAYFQIAKNHRTPFNVISRNQQINVLGTSFNLNAYANEPSINTTLIDGTIQVIDTLSGQKILLKPGQQARLSQSITVSNVDTLTALGWKNSIFYFRGTDLKTVMRQLSRWYDVEVDYSTLPNKTFTGEISRDVNLADVLESMSLTSKLRFKIEERRIMVEP